MYTLAILDSLGGPPSESSCVIRFENDRRQRKPLYLHATLNNKLALSPVDHDEQSLLMLIKIELDLFVYGPARSVCELLSRPSRTISVRSEIMKVN